MGSYTEISVAGYPLIDSKSVVIRELMTVFRETDKRVFERKVFERNPLVWGALDEAEKANQETERAVEYSNHAKKIIDRLNVMGFTLARARFEFEAGRLSEIAKFESWAEDREDTSWFVGEWDVVKEFTFELYAGGLQQIIEQRLRPRPFDDNEKPELSRFVKYMLSQEDYFLGFLGGEPRLLLRIACELVPPDARIIQDITEVTHAGYYEENESVCESAIQELVESYPENSPIIILAEGSSDISILKESLSVLFPHLEGYYSFLEFDSARVPGGAGYLVSMVKAFAGAGIANRIIAIFDNDTAAHDAVRSLKQIRIPPNIAILHYPNLELLRAYPTLGPGGLASLDVNGLAGSVELYLGSDALMDEHGKMYPVQWRGYNEAVRQYQGEVVHKAEIRSAFEAKLDRCKKNTKNVDTSDFEGLRAVFELICHAFD